jgi:hypothetical protein
MRTLWQDMRVRVALGLIVGLVVIIYKNPPHTPCTSQIDDYGTAVLKMAGPFKSKLDECTSHPDAGGCVGFFEVVDRYEEKFNDVSLQCKPELSGSPVYVKWISLAMEMYVRLAWGTATPPSSAVRNGWLEANQVAQFCRLRRNLETVFGQDAWGQFVKDIMPTLPGEPDSVSHFGFNEVWTRTLMADTCNYSY